MLQIDIIFKNRLKQLRENQESEFNHKNYSVQLFVLFILSFVPTDPLKESFFIKRLT